MQILNNKEEYVNSCKKDYCTYGLDRAAYNQGKNAKFNFSVDYEVQPSLVAKGPGAVCAKTTMNTHGTVDDKEAQTRLHDKIGALNHMHDDQAIMIDDDTEYVVRRLTPLECERLQGFPDFWTDGESDSARYKALGNSLALPNALYVISGIAKYATEQ